MEKEKIRKEDKKRVLEERGLLKPTEVNKKIFNNAKEMLEGYGFVRVQQMSIDGIKTKKNAKCMVRIREHRIERIFFETSYYSMNMRWGINQSAFYLDDMYLASKCGMNGYKTRWYCDLFINIPEFEHSFLYLKDIFDEEWEKGMKVQIEGVLEYFDNLGGFEGYCNLADMAELNREDWKIRTELDRKYHKTKCKKIKFDEEWEKGIKPQKEKGINNFVGFGENNYVSNVYEVIRKYRNLEDKDTKILDEIFNYCYNEYDTKNQIDFRGVGDAKYIYLDYGRAISSFINGEYEKGEKLMRDTMKKYSERRGYLERHDSGSTNEKDSKEMKCFVEILDEKVEDWQEKIQEKIKALEKDALAEAWGVELDENGKTIKIKNKKGGNK